MPYVTTALSLPLSLAPSQVAHFLQATSVSEPAIPGNRRNTRPPLILTRSQARSGIPVLPQQAAGGGPGGSNTSHGCLASLLLVPFSLWGWLAGSRGDPTPSSLEWSTRGRPRETGHQVLGSTWPQATSAGTDSGFGRFSENINNKRAAYDSSQN